MAEKPKYWQGIIDTHDDFGVPIAKVFYDGRTKQGPWAIMSPTSWRFYGLGKTGTGLAQKYEQQPDGKWLKTEG